MQEFLDTSRALTVAAHEALGGARGTRPLVVDPFAGGGAIPLEALRVGADAFASDLNPVPVLLNKVVLEYIPKYGQQLADEVRKWGEWIKQEAGRNWPSSIPRLERRNAHCLSLGAHRPLRGPELWRRNALLKSLWLGKKPHNSWSLRIVPRPECGRVDFDVVNGAKPSDVGQATVRRGAAVCPCCGYSTPVASVRGHVAGGTADAATAP